MSPRTATADRKTEAHHQLKPNNRLIKGHCRFEDLRQTKIGKHIRSTLAYLYPPPRLNLDRRRIIANRAEGTCARGLLTLRESECARVDTPAAARHHRRRPPIQEGPGTRSISERPLAKGSGKSRLAQFWLLKRLSASRRIFGGSENMTGCIDSSRSEPELPPECRARKLIRDSARP
jgi:hypothetical protein